MSIWVTVTNRKEVLTDLKKFLNQPEILKLMGDWNFEEIYKKLSCASDFSINRTNAISAFTEICLNKHINPLDYMSYVPSHFLYESKITEFKIPNNIKRIKSSAFANCDLLTNIIIPNSVTTMDATVFYGCAALPSITIPDSVVDMGSSGTCYACEKLKTVKLGKGIIRIPTTAFSDCYALENITIPDNVTSIGDFAFSSCESLASITIGSGVTSIEEKAFYHCKVLKNINYNGTKEQWEAITKGDKWKNGVPKSCKVHCTDGDIRLN